eukprot:379810_1
MQTQKTFSLLKMFVSHLGKSPEIDTKNWNTFVQYLPYGIFTDYPIPEEESKKHYGNKLLIGQIQSTIICPSDAFNVICNHFQCKKSKQSQFHSRMSYTNWIQYHHSITHPNEKKQFVIASFWTITCNGKMFDTEYRLIHLKTNEYIKPPLNFSEAKDDIVKRCSYCHNTNNKLKQCSGCKIVLYCSVNCQKDHWNLIHKKECKLWKVQFKNTILRQQQKQDLEIESFLKLQQMSQQYHAIYVKFSEMLTKRSIITQKQSKTSFFDINENDNIEDIKRYTAYNSMIEMVIKAFDRDGDKRLDFKECRNMLRILNCFRSPSEKTNVEYKNFWYDMCKMLGLIPEYLPSLNSGVYGGYLYSNKQITFGSIEIMESLRILSYSLFAFDDEENEENADVQARGYALKLLTQVYGYAQSMLQIGESSKEDLFEIILDCVPFLNENVVSIIYNYATISGQYVIKISWHLIKWMNIIEDQFGLWDLYDINGNNMYYDLFWLSKCDQKGNGMVKLMIEICNNKKHCDKKIKGINPLSLFGYVEAHIDDENINKQRWSLGSIPSYIPNFSLSLNQHAILIGKVLEIHHLNPKLCHYIYIGIGIRCERMKKKFIVDRFNEIYDTNALWRSHAPKK